MLDALVNIVVELFFAGTRRRVLGLFGKRPHHLVMVFTGIPFWTIVGLLCYAVFDG